MKKGRKTNLGLKQNPHHLLFFDGNQININKYKTWIYEDASTGGASEKKIVSENKHWITEDVSAGGASENFLTRIEGAIKKIVMVKLFR